MSYFLVVVNKCTHARLTVTSFPSAVFGKELEWARPSWAPAARRLQNQFMNFSGERAHFEQLFHCCSQQCSTFQSLTMTCCSIGEMSAPHQVPQSDSHVRITCSPDSQRISPSHCLVSLPPKCCLPPDNWRVCLSLSVLNHSIPTHFRISDSPLETSYVFCVFVSKLEIEMKSRRLCRKYALPWETEGNRWKSSLWTECFPFLLGQIMGNTDGKMLISGKCPVPFSECYVTLGSGSKPNFVSPNCTFRRVSGEQ